MEATELMIGDWVKWKNKYVQVASVSGIVWSFGHIGVGLAYCNDDHLLESHDIKSISPIPLTPEILEKNGWKEAQFWHEYQDGKNTMQACLPDMRGRINGIEIQYFKCEYVHQYQHLLRLCGLNEMADNFII